MTPQTTLVITALILIATAGLEIIRLNRKVSKQEKRIVDLENAVIRLAKRIRHDNDPS